MSNKRRREDQTVDTQLIEIYEDLANTNEEIRLKAAKSLLLKATIEPKPTSEHLNEILRRLLRGLCSSRKAARLGFSIALTELLVQLYAATGRDVPNIRTIPDLIETLQSQTHAGGNVSGQEERDHQFGRLFGAEALVKSGILFKSSVSIESWSQVLDMIYHLAKKKPYLREECGWILYEAVKGVGLDALEIEYTQIVVNKLQENGLTMTAEGVAIWIAAQTEDLQINFPAGTWHGDDPLHLKNKTRLAKILKGTSAADVDQDGTNSKASQKGTWSSKLHFAWDVVLAELLNVRTAKQKSQVSPGKSLRFEDFWEECVDKSLFTASSSEERKYWGFLLFQRMLSDAPEHLLNVLFSPNFMRCLINQLASAERYLHRIAMNALKAIFKRVEVQPAAVVAVINGLLGQPREQINFDKVTKTKTVEKLLTQVDEAALRQLIPTFRRTIMSPVAVDERAAAASRQASADQLVTIVRSKKSISDGDSLGQLQYSIGTRSILALLAEFAYFTIKEDPSVTPERLPNPRMSTQSQEMFRSRISSCLTHLVSTSADPSYFPYTLVRDIHLRKDIDKHCRPLLDTDQNVSDSIGTALKTLEKIQSKQTAVQAARNQLLRAFKLLYSLTILQVYNGDADSVNILDELENCYTTLVKHSTKSEQGCSDVLVEILLSFVAKPSMLFRRISQQVFSACASDLNETGLQSMIKVLETKESVSGQEEMFDRDDDDQDENGSLDVEDIDMADADLAQVSSGDDTDSDEADDKSPSKDAAEDSSHNSDGTDDELAVFDAKLAQALGTRLAADDVDADSGESSDEDMNDEQMEALDKHLEKVFRERKKVTSQKTEKKNAKETIVNFKCRVLELLEIFVKQKHDGVLALGLLLPVLRVIQTTKSPLVSGKACDLMREYVRLCKGKNLPKVKDEDRDGMFCLLQLVHVEAAKQGSNAYTSACSQASLLLVKILAAQDKENLRQAVTVYAKSQERLLLDPRCKMKISFFFDWLNWCVTAKI